MKNIKTRDLIYCALFAALTAIGAFLHFQLFQATITLQFFFTGLAAALATSLTPRSVSCWA